MINRRECPECSSHETEHVYTEWYTDRVEEVRICNDCPTQYSVFYGDPIIEDVFTDE